MTISLSANLSMLFAEVPMAERFGLAKLYGFDSVEIQFPYEHGVEELVDYVRRARVEVGLINIPAGDFLDGGEGLAAVPERQHLFADAVRKTLRYARALKVPCVNVIPGRCLNVSREAEYFRTYQENLAYAAHQFAEEGICCVFEAINNLDVPGFLVHSYRQQIEIIQALQHPNLFAQVDVYHMAMSVGVNHLIESLAAILPLARHLQFADCPGRGEPGAGEIDFHAVLKTIVESGYSGYLAAEYRPTCDTPLSLEWLPVFRRHLTAD